MIFDGLPKMKNLFEFKSKNHKESPVTETVHIHIVGGKSFQDADLIYGIVHITENISAAVVRAHPPGTNEKALSGKPFKIENAKGVILEISTEAKYDYKETGMWSKWPNPQKLIFSELSSNIERSEDISVETPCQIIILDPPVIDKNRAKMKIDFKNELVYDFFKNKFLNKSTKMSDEFVKKLKIQPTAPFQPYTWSNIILQIAGHNIPFIVVYAYPDGEVKIDENTHIHYIIPEVNPNNYRQKLRVYPFPSKEFEQGILSRVPGQGLIRYTS